jgi:hypothetical protein
VCGTCGKTFTRERNLRRHEETQHPDQNTPEAAVKRLKDTTSCNTRRRERRVDDPVYREKQRQKSQTNRMNKKARVGACAAGGADADASAASIAEAEKEGDGMPPPTGIAEAADEKNVAAEWIPTDVVPTPQPPPIAPKIVEVLGEDGAGVGGVGKPVKKARKKDKSKDLPLGTELCTKENMFGFFEPKPAPRSKEQRAANPRPSAI